LVAGYTWGDLFETPQTDVPPTIESIYWQLVLIAIFTVLAWYFDNTLPGDDTLLPFASGCLSTDDLIITDSGGLTGHHRGFWRQIGALVVFPHASLLGLWAEQTERSSASHYQPI